MNLLKHPFLLMLPYLTRNRLQHHCQQTYQKRSKTRSIHQSQTTFRLQ